MAVAGVLLTTRNLPPLKGGMERLNAHLAAELSSRFHLYVCGPQGVNGAALGARQSHAALGGGLASFLFVNFFATLWLALRYRPSLILAGSGLTAPAAWCAARLSGARCAVYLHGLDVVVDNLLYRWIWLPFIRRVDAYLVNSRSTEAHACNAGVTAARVTVLSPGVEWPALPGRNVAEFRRRYAFGERPLLLALGRLTARKGLAEFIERVLPTLCSTYPDLLLVVIGSEPSEALKHGVGERARIEATIARQDLSDAVRLLGSLDDEAVATAMQASHALIFPVLDLPGDAEGFGMVAVEAAAQGLPTVAFAVGGVVDSVENRISGDLLPSGNYTAMTEVLVRRLARGPDTAERDACRAFAARFAWSEFGSRLDEWVHEVTAE